jgi:predicted HTH domain antitoxin
MSMKSNRLDPELLAAALKQFEAGEISAGFACEALGIDRWSFYRECNRRRIPTINYSAEELQAELESLRHLS